MELKSLRLAELNQMRNNKMKNDRVVCILKMVFEKLI